ncbi:hypothetical protein AVEN_128678-1 [Araneus ventricosus]|uniref:Uncharacterized protein n=1 Tax=Araneus ventricosus TaxID=182803 RepID=A0A4Y2MNI2_ARAVE|nr:hypothetical protein AVEN_128678-1 [Araneus ventricosus]
MIGKRSGTAMTLNQVGGPGILCLRKLHSNRNSVNSHSEDEKNENEVNQKNNLLEYENGNGVHEDDLSPRHNKLIAQWEQRIQKAES